MNGGSKYGEIDEEPLSVIRRWLSRDKLTKAPVDRLIHQCHILETGNERYRMKNSTSNQETTREKKKHGLNYNLLIQVA